MSLAVLVLSVVSGVWDNFLEEEEGCRGKSLIWYKFPGTDRNQYSAVIGIQMNKNSRKESPAL